MGEGVSSPPVTPAYLACIFLRSRWAVLSLPHLWWIRDIEVVLGSFTFICLVLLLGPVCVCGAWLPSSLPAEFCLLSEGKLEGLTSQDRNCREGEPVQDVWGSRGPSVCPPRRLQLLQGQFSQGKFNLKARKDSMISSQALSFTPKSCCGDCRGLRIRG